MSQITHREILVQLLLYLPLALSSRQALLSHIAGPAAARSMVAVVGSMVRPRSSGSILALVAVHNSSLDGLHSQEEEEARHKLVVGRRWTMDRLCSMCFEAEAQRRSNLYSPFFIPSSRRSICALILWLLILDPFSRQIQSLGA